MKTAVGVMGEYPIRLYKNMVHGILVWCLALIIFFRMPKFPRVNNLKKRFVALGIEAIVFVIFFVSAERITIETWNKHGTRMNGYFLNFYKSFTGSKIAEPQKYDPNLKFMDGYVTDGTAVKTGNTSDNIAEVDSDKSQNHSEKDVNEKTEKQNPPSGESVLGDETKKDYPNIIVIMNESFSDPSVLGKEIKTNIPLTPFYDSLSENTIKGYALSSVFGANTANSEFELLTGHTMAFMPEGSVPYQQYIHGQLFLLLTSN